MKIFALFDEDGTGGISFRNLKRIATELGESLTDDEMQVGGRSRLTGPVQLPQDCTILAARVCAS